MGFFECCEIALDIESSISIGSNIKAKNKILKKCKILIDISKLKTLWVSSRSHCKQFFKRN